MNNRMKFKAVFKGYRTVDDTTHYLVRRIPTHVLYFISCKEYPEYVGELKVDDKLEIEADFDRQVSQGGVLKDIVWRKL